MRIDANATKFDPQVMALAMPSESAFTKGAEGISNIGKVFIDADVRAEASKLNALKMEEANQSIIGKQNENSVFGENQLIKQNTYLQEKRKRLAEADGLDFKNKKDVDDLADSKTQQSVTGLLTPEHYTKDGKFDQSSFDAFRAKVVSDPALKGKEHLVHNAFDIKLKSILETDKTKSEIGYKGAQTKKEIEETAWIAPKAKAYVATQASVVTKNNAGANLDNVNASLAPQKVAIAQTKEQRLGGSVDGKTIKDLTPKERLRYATDPAAMEQLFPNYEKLGPKNKAVVNQKFIQGIYADGISEDPKGDADNNWRPTYQKKDLPPLPAVLPSTRPSSQTQSSTTATKVLPKQKSLFQQSLEAGK